MEADVLRYFEQIEALGGVIPALETGFFQKEIADASARFQREIETHDRTIVGVNDFITEEPLEIPILRMDPEGERRHLARLKATKANRDQQRWADAMARLEQASRSERENTMPYILEVVNAGGTVGEVCNLWRRVYGEYKELVVV
jgi:methylmalonyl-CoA mutase N-terminal domain/subunit